MVKSLLNPKAKSAKKAAEEQQTQQKNVMESYRTLIASQEKEIAELKKDLLAVESKYLDEVWLFCSYTNFSRFSYIILL
jgi:hypothetical protein